MIGIIPAAGFATRMRGLPKFLLPAPNKNMTLLDYHINELLKVCDKVLVGTRQERLQYINTDISAEFYAMETETMTDTIIKLCNISDADQFIISMPDTVFVGESPFKKTSSLNDADINMAVWATMPHQMGTSGQVLIDDYQNVIDIKDKDKNCKYDHHWGMLAFNRKFIDIMNKDLPPGFSINPAIDIGLKVKAKIIEGEYFDCGTFEGYNSAYKAVLGH